LERETYSALALLNSADKILVAVAEPGLFEVRQALARETVTLRAMPALDVEGVFVTLAALSEQVQSLALLTPPAEENVAEAANIALQDAPKEGQKTVFAAALAYFNDKVAIRHRAKALAPLLTPEQHNYVQQNLRLMLEQAQLALLQRQSGVYTRSLDKAMSWLDEYFQLNQTAQRLRASLGELQQLQIAAEAPDISASLLLLKAYLSAPVEVAQSATAAPQTEQPEQQKSTTEVVQ
jgi:uroporphyrin-3 C-methyltransferase